MKWGLVRGGAQSKYYSNSMQPEKQCTFSISHEKMLRLNDTMSFSSVFAQESFPSRVERLHDQKKLFSVAMDSCTEGTVLQQ